MSIYCHERAFKARYSDVDFKDELKASALLSYTQEVACSSADELGFGYDVLREKNYGFLIVSTCVELKKPICLGEVFWAQTWPLPPRHVIFERDYRLLSDEGDILANVASRWCLVDLSNMSLLTGDKLEAHAKCPYRAEQTMSPQWKIAKLNGEGELCGKITIKHSLCDHYLHLNNARYADLFFDCFTMDELSARKITGFSIVYHKQVQEGKTVEFYRKDENAFSILEARVEGEVVTQFRVSFEG